jgi:hypothetical protein
MLSIWDLWRCQCAAGIGFVGTSPRASAMDEYEYLAMHQPCFAFRPARTIIGCHELLQWDISTGTGMALSIALVTPPSRNSRKRAWP